MFASVDVNRTDRQARDYGYVQTAASGVWSLIPEDRPTAGLADAQPSAWTAAEIEAFATDQAALTDAQVLDTIVGCERLIAWAHAQQIRLLAEFDRRRPGDEPTAVATDEPTVMSRWAPDELGLALHVGRLTAKSKLAEAVRITRGFPDTPHALQAGTITFGKAQVISEVALTMPLDLAREVEERVLAKAADQTWAQFRQNVHSQVLRVDPGGGKRRHAAT
jgi:hypothetical protein